MKKYAVIYYPNGNEREMKFVGCVSDYQDGGLADPVLMSKAEADELMADLTEYVKHEYIGKNDADNAQAHYAFEHGMWGFDIDEFDIEETYDVVFNDDVATNAKGMQATKEDAIHYVQHFNGTGESFFADYKGGVVQVVCNETGDVVYEETVR